MASFIVRIQLFGADSEDYEELHEKMNNEKFTKTIRDSNDGKLLELPDAEYHYVSNLSCDEVRDKARRIANSVKNGSIVLVSEYSNLSWFLYPKD